MPYPLVDAQRLGVLLLNFLVSHLFQLPIGQLCHRQNLSPLEQILTHQVTVLSFWLLTGSGTVMPVLKPCIVAILSLTVGNFQSAGILVTLFLHQNLIESLFLNVMFMINTYNLSYDFLFQIFLSNFFGGTLHEHPFKILIYY
jgi:hypothetical protein